MRKNLSFITQLFVSLILALGLNHYLIKNTVSKFLFVKPGLVTLVYFALLLIQILFFYNIIYLIINGKINKTCLNTLIICYASLLLILLFGRPQSKRVMNLNPFSSNLMDIITLCNILLFIPLGIFFRKTTLKNTLVISTLIILSIETLQFIFKLGVFDTADIIFNVLGITIGFFIANRYLQKLL